MIYVREKILLTGGSNSGKTHALVRFAFEVIASGHRAFLIDADDSIPKLVAEMDEFADIRDLMGTSVFEVAPVYGYSDAHSAVEKFRRWKPAQGDLVGVEMVSYYWDWAQTEYTETVKDKSVAELQLDKAENGRLQFGGLDGKSEWPVIKRLYQDITTPTLQSPAHVIWTANTKPTIKELDNPLVLEMFGSVGQKPEGEKNTHYKVDTLFYLGLDRKTNTRTWTTLKDRGKRQRLSNIQYQDLFPEYYSMHDLTPPWGTR